jgi:hypothetical protein
VPQPSSVGRGAQAAGWVQGGRIDFAPPWCLN